jgi:hypothetical protein
MPSEVAFSAWHPSTFGKIVSSVNNQVCAIHPPVTDCIFIRAKPALLQS